MFLKILLISTRLLALTEISNVIDQFHTHISNSLPIPHGLHTTSREVGTSNFILIPVAFQDNKGFNFCEQFSSF